MQKVIGSGVWESGKGGGRRNARGKERRGRERKGGEGEIFSIMGDDGVGEGATG